MGEWKTKPLGDFINLQRGHDLPKHKRIDGKVPIISSSGISGYHNESKGVAPGVITGRYGTIGEVFYVDQSYWPLNTSLYVTDFKGNDPKFIYYFLKAFPFAKFNDKSTVPGINRNHVHREEVSIPPVNIQEQIAHTLSLLDAKIDLLREQNETLEGLGAAVFREWFLEGEGIYRVADIADHIKISVKPSVKPESFYHHFSLPAYDDGKRAKLEQGESILSNKYGIPDNCILVSKLNPRFPRVWLITDAPANAICSTEFQVFQPKDLNYLEFLYFFFKSSFAKNTLMMSASGTSGSHQRVRPQDMLDLEFSYNNYGQIVAFAELASPLMNKMIKNENTIQELEATRDLLLPKLMSGEVTVRSDE